MNNRRNTFVGGTKKGGIVVVVATTTNGAPMNHTLLLVKEKITGGEIISIFTDKVTKDVFEISQLKLLVLETVYKITGEDYRDYNYNLTSDFDSIDPDYFSITNSFDGSYKEQKIKSLSYNYVKDNINPLFHLDYEHTAVVINNDLPKAHFNAIDPSIYTSEEDLENIELNILSVGDAELPSCAVATKKAFEKGTHNCALFYGEASTGKTFAAKMIAAGFRVPVYSYNFSAGSDESVVQGKFAPKENGSGFALLKSLFIKAYTEGGIFIAEELNYAFANVTGPLNSALDIVKKITLANETYIPMHPNFRMITCINPGYEGTQPLNRALLSRQEIVVRFNNLTPEEISSRLKNRFGYSNEEFSIKIGAFINKLNKTLYSQSIDGYASLREIESFIKLSLVDDISFLEALKQSVLNKVMLNETDEVYNTVLDVIKNDLKDLEESYSDSLSDDAELEDLIVSNIDDSVVDDIFAGAKAAYSGVAPDPTVAGV